MTLVSLAFGLFLTSGTIKDYLEYDVFTQTKIFHANSSLMPSVTFCFNTYETKDLISFFNKTEFKISNGLPTNLTGEEFSDDYFGDCIKFNHNTNKSVNSLFIARSLDDGFYFMIDLKRVHFDDVHVFLSDNYNNILDWSQFVTKSFYVKGYYIVDIEKEFEHKLEEPYNPCQNVSDITYRQTNCIAMCKNRNFVAEHSCTQGNYYSIPGYNICEK